MSTVTVKHGRRKGASKDSTKTSGNADSSKAAVLTAGEWERIKASLTRKQREESAKRREREEKANLHATSKGVVKNWENTIEGQRQKKLQAKRIREEREEEERKKIDIEEAKYQAEKRREAIERAKTLQSYQTDRVKGFHGALLLSEVLRERDAQVEYEKLKREAMRNRDKGYLEKIKEDFEKSLLEEQDKATRRREACVGVSEFQKKQIEKRLKEEEKAREEDRREGEAIKKDFGVFLKEKKEVEEKRRKGKVDLCEALVETIEDKRQREAERGREVERHEQGVREFAQAKRKMMRMKKERERELFKQFQDHQDHMVGLLATQMKEKCDDDDRKIALAVEEAERKREAEEWAKAEKHGQQQKSIREHRTQMMAEKEKLRREEEELDLHFLRQQVESDLKFKSDVSAKEQRRREEAKKLLEFHQDQSAVRQGKEEKQKEEFADMDRRHVTRMRQEEEEFQRYAEKVIDEAKARGGHVYPLAAAVKAGPGGGRGPVFDSIGGLKPSYQVADGTGVQMPTYCVPRVRKGGAGSVGSTQKRMGFTW